jgi:predicted RNA-binding protein associated with RNAse of E/G family
VLREVCDGRVWTLTPVRVVQDRPDLLALYTSAGTMRKRPVGKDGQFLRLPDQAWSLVDEACKMDSLRLVTPGACYSVLLLWTEGQQEFLGWYINLEDPLCRTSVGFDFLDQVLDIVSRDRREWQWKDEDEFLEARARGLIAAEKAQMLRHEGERAMKLVGSGLFPFQGEWVDWRPHSSWRAPQIP